MSKKILFLIIITSLVFVAFTGGYATAREKYYTPDEVAQKKQDLESLNLLKGLTLSNDQMLKLLPLLYEMRLQNREVMLGYKKDGKHAMEMMRMLEGRIYKGEGVDVPVEEKVWFALGTLYEYEYDRYRMTEKMVKKAKGILNENQLRIVSEYMPCVIPWAAVRASDRIGQSGSIHKLEKLLDRLRTLKGKEYEMQKRLFLVELDWRMRIERRENKRTRQILVREIDGKIDRICRMPEEEYQLKKEELAQSIRPPDLEILPPRVGDALDEAIEKYVLNPNNIKYIQLKLEKEGLKYPLADDEIDEDIDKEVD